MRRAGELLKQVSRHGGDRKSEENQRTGGGPLISRREAAHIAGMSGRQAKNAVRLANIPETDFNEQVDSPNPPTITALAEQGKQKRTQSNPDTWLKGRRPLPPETCAGCAPFHQPESAPKHSSNGRAGFARICQLSGIREFGIAVSE